MREKFRRTHTGEECSEQLKGNINKMRIIEDLHTHTYYSHGKNGPRDNVLRALELGLEAVAVSDMRAATCITVSAGKNWSG